MMMNMVLVAVKCPKCGGTVQIEEKMTSGFCVHCGSKILNERETAGSEKGTDITFYLKKAKESLIRHDWEAASGLVKDILLMDPECQDAWYMKALLGYRDGSSESMISKAESGGMKSYGIFSKEDVSKCWGEFDLKVTYELPKNTILTLKAQVTVDGKESLILDRGQSAIFGADEGIHEISVCFLVKNGTSEADKLSFIATKDHEFVVKTVAKGGMFRYMTPKMVQLS